MTPTSKDKAVFQTARHAGFRPRGLRRPLRHAALTYLSWQSRIRRKTRVGLDRNRVHFLFLHHLFQDEEESFRSLLSRLSRSHQFVSYSDAIRRVRQGEIDRPYVNLSFDDGLASCIPAARIMDEFDAKGCFFVSPPIVEESDPNVISEFVKTRLNMPPVGTLNWDDVAQLQAAGHEIGSHSLTHRRLSTLGRAELEDEIAHSRELLIRRTGSGAHFAWPYGRFSDFSREGLRLVYSTGYESCASAERGCHATVMTPAESDLCIRREHVIAGWPASHIEYFMATSSLRSDRLMNGWPRDSTAGS